MTCEPMWIRASAQSTSVPFIQILPLPNGIEELLAGRTTDVVHLRNAPAGGYHSTVARGGPGRTRLRDAATSSACVSAGGSRAGLQPCVLLDVSSPGGLPHT